MSWNVSLNISGITGLEKRCRQYLDANATPLMAAWMKILFEGNRRGILAGLDGEGNPMVPVRYRPVGKPVKHRTRGLGAFLGSAADRFGNLTSAEYRRLTGPPLAPRGTSSRAITNYKTDYAKLPSGVWQVTYWWEDVFSVQGRPFLRYHFLGAGRLPRRDLRGIRPADLVKIRDAKRAWMADLVRTYG